MANPVADTAAYIPGGHVSSIGGCVIVEGNADEMGNTNDVYLDVRHWTLNEVFEEVPLVCSGGLGFASSRRVSYRATFAFEHVWDLRKLPVMLLRPLGGVRLYFMLGEDRMGSTVIAPAAHASRYYWINKGVIDSAQTILDASGHKMVAQIITGHAVTHPMLLPNLGALNAIDTMAGAYYSYLH
jgi:hypothetical protein